MDYHMRNKLTGCSLLLRILVFSSFFIGCSTPKIQFQSTQDVILTAKKLGDPADSGALLKINTQVDAADLVGKMVQVSMKDRPPYYWVFYSPAAGDVNVKVDDLSGSGITTKDKDGSKEAPKVEKPNPNTLPRTIFMAMRALDQKDFKSAEELADQMTKSHPDVALPYIVKGLIKITEGKKSDGVALFKTAKALDPGDAEIDKLLMDIGP